MGQTIGKPLGAYRRPIVSGLISLAKLPANLSVRPPACFPDWKILGKVDGQHAGKLDIPVNLGNLSETFREPNLSRTSREPLSKPFGNLWEPLGNLSGTSRNRLGNLSETCREPLANPDLPIDPCFIRP